ncbi:MAG TPA: osmotically inducible protein OsmC [Verrucomicrobia bacterium]|nr:osmotically inducible protein OsmC [Verrucomicrobiota bacterium]
MRTVTVAFPGGKKVDAQVEGFTVKTDQRLAHGGEQTAPNPFDYFFVSLATCAGISALDYCQQNNLSTDGLAVTLKAHRHPSQPRYDRIVTEVTLPRGLTETQQKALLAEVEDCTVKRHILTPPRFDLVCIPSDS